MLSWAEQKRCGVVKHNPEMTREALHVAGGRINHPRVGWRVCVLGPLLRSEAPRAQTIVESARAHDASCG